MKFFRFLCILICFSASGQNPEVLRDSLLSTPKLEAALDSPGSDELKKLIRKDSTGKFIKTMSQVFGVRPYERDEKPRVSFVRSLVVPGWGQISNRDYWKAGIVYASAGAGWYWGIRNNQRNYEKYLGHYSRATLLSRGQVYISTDLTEENRLPVSSQLYLLNNNQANVLYARSPEGIYYTLKAPADQKKASDITYYLAQKATVGDSSVIGAFSVQTFSSAKNQFRRWRDAAYIGFAAGWLFFALEANVAAHLKTFDMSEDISMKITPAGPSTFGMQALGAKVAFEFK